MEEVNFLEVFKIIVKNKKVCELPCHITNLCITVSSSLALISTGQMMRLGSEQELL